MKRAWFSSYEKNNYGEFFYSLVRFYQPKRVVELGTKAGFSAYHIAQGLKDNSKGQLDCYDLWENYQFNSVPKFIAEENLKEFSGIVSLNARDVFDVEALYESVDILHIDISNEGEILEKIVPKWIDKINKFIVIEGGSTERDKIKWMVKFKKKPIATWLKDFKNRRGDIDYLTIKPFPSVTIIRKL